jgi:hypothetical protein
MATEQPTCDSRGCIGLAEFILIRGGLRKPEARCAKHAEIDRKAGRKVINGPSEWRVGLPKCRYCGDPAIGEIPKGELTGLPPEPVCRQHALRAGKVVLYTDDPPRAQPVPMTRNVNRLMLPTSSLPDTASWMPASAVTGSMSGGMLASAVTGMVTGVPVTEGWRNLLVYSDLAAQQMAAMADDLPPVEREAIDQLLEETNQMPTVRPTIIDSVEVPSDSNPRTKYTVTVDDQGGATCDCMNYVMQGIRKQNLSHQCKHIQAVLNRSEVQAKIQSGGASRRPGPKITREEVQPSVYRRRGQSIDL